MKNKLPLLLLLVAGAAVAKYVYDKRGNNILSPSGGTTPEQRAANIKSQMQMALNAGDNKKYLSLQEQLELVELETGL